MILSVPLAPCFFGAAPRALLTPRPPPPAHCPSGRCLPLQSRSPLLLSESPPTHSVIGCCRLPRPRVLLCGAHILVPVLLVGLDCAVLHVHVQRVRHGVARSRPTSRTGTST